MKKTLNRRPGWIKTHGLLAALTIFIGVIAATNDPVFLFSGPRTLNAVLALPVKFHQA